VTWQIAPGWYSKWVIPEGYGILEFSQFVTMMAALYRRAAAFQAFRAQAPVRFRRNHHHAGVASTLPARR
jgi:hypothetical protein